jgi:hypothetical protein
MDEMRAMALTSRAILNYDPNEAEVMNETALKLTAAHMRACDYGEPDFEVGIDSFVHGLYYFMKWSIEEGLVRVES